MGQRFWGKAASSYDKNSQKVYGISNKRIIELATNYCKQGTRLLDVGCGTGMLTIELANYVGHIDAIDSSSEMLKIAKKNSEQHRLTNICWKKENIIEKEAVHSTYHIVTAFNVWLNLKHAEELEINVYDHLMDGGYFLSVTDCYGESVNFVRMLQLFLSKCGILPYTQSYKTKDLIDMIENSGFDIEFSENVHSTPPNFFIVARKKGRSA